MTENLNPTSKEWWKKKIEKSIDGQETSWKNKWSRIAVDKLRGSNQEVETEREIETKLVQWSVKVSKEGYEIANLGEDGSKKFYSLDNGKYGQPLITAEPDRAFDHPSGVEFTNVDQEVIGKPEERISGVICQEDDGTVVHRFSLSNPNAPEFKQIEGGLTINGEEWYLNVLFDKDGQRIQNHDGYYSRIRPEKVRVIELQDLNFVASSEPEDNQQSTWKSLVSDRVDLKRLAKKTHNRFKSLFKKKEESERQPDFEQKVVQWTIRIWEDEKYEIVNLDDDGTQRFYKIISGKYGQPLIIAEPDKAFEVPEKAKFTGVDGEEVEIPSEKISGVICQEDGGSITHRFSLSNPKTPKFRVTKDGIILFLRDEETGKTTKERWYLNVLFDKDGQRIQNYDGYYSRKKPREIRVLELQDLNFFASSNLGLSS